MLIDPNDKTYVETQCLNVETHHGGSQNESMAHDKLLWANPRQMG